MTSPTSSPPSTLAEQIDVAARILGGAARRDAPTSSLTTYRLGGPAALLVEATDDEVVALLARAVQASGLPVLAVGKGSNLLVSDRGFGGIVVTLGGAYAEIEVDAAAATVRAGAAVSLPVLARRTAAAGLTGLEWAVGVPGSVGGAVRMNAGGHGSQTVETLRRCRVLDLRSGRDQVVGAEELGMGYRRSGVLPHQLVLWAEHQLATGDREQAEATISDIVRWRREHQPGGRNAGSVFTNPAGASAGQLIDAAGLRGHRLGSAEVSPKHANFIQSEDGGTAADVVALMHEVQDGVLASSGILLVPEVRLVGFDAEELGTLGASIEEVQR